MSQLTKRQGESITVKCDFSDRLEHGENLETVLVQGLSYGSESVIADYSLDEIDYVTIQTRGGSVVKFSRSYPVGGMTSARLVLSTGVESADEIIGAISVDSSSYAKEVNEGDVRVIVVGGEAGHTYRVRFTATTNYSSTLIEEITINVTD